MSRTSRWLVGLAAAFLALLALFVIAVTAIVDPNAYRGEIERAVRDATGRAFELQGDIDIAWFPWLALETGPALLGNPAGFDAGPPLLQWRHANVGARVWPLLTGRLVVDRIRVEGLQVQLRVDAAGRANWETLTARPVENGGGPPAIPVNSGLEIRAGSLQYHDARSGTRFAITDWTLDLGAFRSGAPVAVRTAFRYRDVPIAFAENALTLDLEARRIAAPAWSVRLADAQLDGTLRAADRLRRIEGSVRGTVPALRRLLAALGIEAPNTRDTAVLGPMRLSGTWRYEGGAVSVQPLELRVDDTTLRGTLARAPTASSNAEPAWTFELVGDRIDLDRYRAPEAAVDEPFELPVERLKAANVRGTLRFDTARLAGVSAEDVTLSIETEARQ